MARILLLGNHPPPFLPGQKIEAAHYRTWQFLEPLLETGQRVLLCAGVKGEAPESPDRATSQLGKGTLEYRHIRFGERSWMHELQRAHDDFHPDCIVAVNFSHCLYATRLKTNRPVWMDIYGDTLTIQQAYCHRLGSNRGMATAIRFLRQILRFGDVFSVCGQPQKHMLVGELGVCGRLNHRTFGYDFVRVVLPGSVRPQLSEEKSEFSSLRSQIALAPDDFAVLWCGGYNTWTDIDTLFKALEWVMGRDPRVHFVSVGASTYDSPDNMYSRFESLVACSTHKDRFHLLGWQPWQQVSQYYQGSQVGVNIDAMHYETVYGTRTRLVEMIGSGLPVLSTAGTELSYLLEKWGAGSTFEVGDWQELGSQILRLAREEGLRQKMAEAARRCAQNQLSFSNTTSCLRAWVESPKKAPDGRTEASSGRSQEVRHQARALVRSLIWQVTGADK